MPLAHTQMPGRSLTGATGKSEGDINIMEGDNSGRRTKTKTCSNVANGMACPDKTN